MPDRKITDLVDGDPLQPTDEFVVARGGDNFKIDGSAVVAAVTKHDVTLAGNTAGALAHISSGTMTLAGGNNITLSQAGNAVTISGGAGGAETQTAISGISASNTLYTSGTVRFTGVGGGVTVSSNTGQRVDISVAAPVAQTEQTQNLVDLTLSGNTAGALALISSGTATLAGGNNITLSQNGNAITISGANVGGAQTGISGIANSQTTYTSGTVSLSELGAITIRSTTGQQFQFSVNPQSVQPETQTFIAGISASNTLYTSGNVRFTGVGGGVTVSSNTGQRVDISVAAQSVQPETQTFVAGIQNSQTTYTSGTVNLSVVAGNLTIRSTTGQAFQFSASQSVQPETQTAISGLANSQTTYTSGTVSFSELGAITIRSTTGQQFQFSVNSQTVQTQGILSAGVSTGGNTAGNTTVNTGSRFVIVGSNGITASQGTAAGATTVTLSGITQSVQTNDIPRLGVSTGGNTAGDTTVNSGTRFVLVGSNMVSLSQATAASATTVTINATQTAQTQGIINAGVSTGGNTSGDTGVNSGTRLVFVGSNNITLSQGTAANATTITISGGAGGGYTFSGGMSTNGNTSGDTGYATQRLNLVGGNNITLSGSTNAGSMSITISAPNLGAGAMSAGASNLGNTAGSTGITGTQLVIVGTGPISLSQSTGANGGTLSINAPATSSLSATGNLQISTNGSTISIGDGQLTLDFVDNIVGSSTTFQHSDAALNVFPLNPANKVFPGYMSVSTMFLDMSGTVSTGAAFTRSLSVGFYTRVNSTQLSLSASASTSWGTNAANMLINDSMGGRRWVTLHSSQFNNPPNFSNGSDYFVAFWHRSSSGSQTFAYQGGLLPFATGIRSGFMSAASATNTTNAHFPFLGNYSVSFTTAMPNALAASDVNKSNATAISLPRLIFNNVGTQIL